MKVLVTGAAGFIGGYLTKHCIEAGASVLGIDIRHPEHGWPGAAFEPCDVRDSARLCALLSAFRPERIFHLAAQSQSMLSWKQPRETMDSNAGGTISLFECLRASAMKPVVVVACSSAEYGSVAAEDLPVKEDHPLRPLHPYGVSKVAQDSLAAQYFAAYAIPAIRVRIFNTTGPEKQGDVCSDLTKRAIEIELGKCPPSLAVGNLKNRRSMVDVRDLVPALWSAAEHCQAGEAYNLGGNEVYSVEQLIEVIRAQLEISFQVQQRPELMRACDELAIAGDNAKFRDRCLWQPKITLAATVRDMLAWWRSRLVAGVPRTLRHEAAQFENLSF
jgi:GDP-4-dehydro-6-deoxy-D-mannose reductase